MCIFGQDRRRRPQGLARRQGAGRPGADAPRVVVGQRLVASGFFLDLEHVLGTEELPLVAQDLVELLGGVGLGAVPAPTLPRRPERSTRLGSCSS
jgi:hypothetical protein